jgi:hypothetical protein
MKMVWFFMYFLKNLSPPEKFGDRLSLVRLIILILNLNMLPDFNERAITLPLMK